MRNKRKKVPVSRSGLFFIANGMFPKDNSKAVIESACDLPHAHDSGSWMPEDIDSDYSKDTDTLFFHPRTIRCNSVARTDLVLEVAHGAYSRGTNPVFFNYDYDHDDSGLF